MLGAYDNCECFMFVTLKTKFIFCVSHPDFDANTAYPSAFVFADEAPFTAPDHAPLTVAFETGFPRLFRTRTVALA